MLSGNESPAVSSFSKRRHLFPMDEITLLQNLNDEIVALREIVYCAGILCVFLLAFISGNR